MHSGVRKVHGTCMALRGRPTFSRNGEQLSIDEVRRLFAELMADFVTYVTKLACVFAGSAMFRAHFRPSRRILPETDPDGATLAGPIERYPS